MTKDKATINKLVLSVLGRIAAEYDINEIRKTCSLEQKKLSVDEELFNTLRKRAVDAELTDYLIEKINYCLFR